MSESDEPPEAEKWINADKFLTDDERVCLRGGEVEYESQKRYRIRYKTLGALNDLFEINSGLSNKNAGKLFEGVGNVTTKDTTRDTADGERDVLPGREGELSAIVALACRGYYLNSIKPEQFISQVVVPGMRKGLADSHEIHPSRISVNIDADIEVYDDISELADRLEEEGADSITEEEAYLLYSHDRLSIDEYTDVLETINQ
jgi:hypothetical protein